MDLIPSTKNTELTTRMWYRTTVPSLAWHKHRKPGTGGWKHGQVLPAASMHGQDANRKIREKKRKKWLTHIHVQVGKHGGHRQAQVLFGFGNTWVCLHMIQCSLFFSLTCPVTWLATPLPVTTHACLLLSFFFFFFLHVHVYNPPACPHACACLCSCLLTHTWPCPATPVVATPVYLPAQWVWWVVFSFLLYSCAHTCNPPTAVSPCPLAAPLCAHACWPAHTCLSLHPALHLPACLCPTPANLHPTMPDHTCCGCPCLPASTMSLVSRHFFFYFIFVFTFPIHLHLCPCAHVCICVPVPASMSLCLHPSVLTPADSHLIHLATPVVATPACLPLHWVWWVVFTFFTLFLCSCFQSACVHVPVLTSVSLCPCPCPCPMHFLWTNILSTTAVIVLNSDFID